MRVQRSLGKSAEGESCFQRLKRLNWRDASGNRDTYPRLRENIWPRSYNWLQRKWRFGFRTIGTKWKEPELRKDWTRICSLRAGFVSPFWWGTEDRAMFSVLRTSLVQQRLHIVHFIWSNSLKFNPVTTSAPASWHVWHLAVAWDTCSLGPGEELLMESFYASELRFTN